MHIHQICLWKVCQYSGVSMLMRPILMRHHCTGKETQKENAQKNQALLQLVGQSAVKSALTHDDTYNSAERNKTVLNL